MNNSESKVSPMNESPRLQNISMQPRHIEKESSSTLVLVTAPLSGEINQLFLS